MEQAFTILATAMVMFSGFFLYEQFRRLWSQIADLNRVIEGLKAENAKLEEASSKRHLPYRTLEDLEHAKAAWIALDDELQIKRALLDNLGVWIDRAREDKRARA